MLEHRIRNMSAEDLEQVLHWRNHPEVRRYMYSTHEICFAEHQQWFHRVSTNPSVELLIYEREGQAVGYINLTRTRSEQVADWGFYIAPGAPKGSGRYLGRLALEHAFITLGLHKLCGQALRYNERSVNFHFSLGFTKEGHLREQHFDGKTYQDVICFGLLKKDWQASQEIDNERT